MAIVHESVVSRRGGMTATRLNSEP